MRAETLELRDVREGGRWTTSQRLKNSCIRSAVIAALAVLDRLPRSWLVALLRTVGGIAHRFDRAGRARAERRIAAALPDVDAPALARVSYVVAGESLAECLLLRRPAVSALERVEIDRKTRSMLKAGNGVIAVSAHLGPFELIAAAVAELGSKPAVVVRESYDPRLDPVVDRHRNARGVEVIHRGRPGASLCIVRALRNARPVGILPDLGGRVPCTAVRFLGREQAFPIGPARLALRTEAALVCLTLERRPGAPYRMVARVIDAIGDEHAVTQRIAQALDSAILSSPEAWLWMAGESADPSLGLEKKPGVR